MKRILLFLLLLLLFTLWRFPHRRVVEAMLARPLTPLGFQLSIAEVGYAFPLGYRLDGVRLSHDQDGLAIQSLTLQPSLRHGLNLSASACSGSIDGSLGSRHLALSFSDLDPSDCIDSGTLRLQGRFSGELDLDSPGWTRGHAPAGAGALKGHLELQSPSGTVSGSLPARSGGTPFALGEWEFRDLSAKTQLSGDAIDVSAIQAFSQGIDWQLTRGRVSRSSPDTLRIAAELRARATGKPSRAKAMFALLPKAAVAADGWRHYRIGGSLHAPTLIGLR